MNVNGISRRLIFCARQLDRLSSRDFSALGLGSGQVRLLLVILENPGINQEHLTSYAGVDKSTTAKSVSRLETAGYVQRKGNIEDRRVRHLFPTDLAVSVRPELQRRLRHVHEVLLRGFLEGEIARLSGYLTRMLENLEQEMNRESGPIAPVSRSNDWG